MIAVSSVSLGMRQYTDFEDVSETSSATRRQLADWLIDQGGFESERRHLIPEDDEENGNGEDVDRHGCRFHDVGVTEGRWMSRKNYNSAAVEG
jgi:hypothetical protein